jgi:hypothetical protein
LTLRSAISTFFEVKDMFVNNEITDRGLLHRLLKKEAGSITMDEREIWARSADNAIKDATRPSTMVRLRLTRPAVVMTAAPALSAVSAALRDEELAVSRQALDAVRAFMTDGISSPLYGRDPLAAQRAAEALRSLVTTSMRVERSHAPARQSAAV